MGFKSRRFSISHEGESIEFEAKLDDKKWNTVGTLRINGEISDEVRSPPQKGLFGCEYQLSGNLRNEDQIALTIRASFFMRPLYTVSVNGVEIYREKGTWGGM